MGGHPYTCGNDPHPWVCGCGSLVGVGVGWHLKPMGSPTQITMWNMGPSHMQAHCYSVYKATDFTWHFFLLLPLTNCTCDYNCVH